MCGQALSHCVKWTVKDILIDWNRNNVPTHKLFLLQNGSSPVFRYEQDANEFLADMREENVTVTMVERAFEGL